MRKLVLLIAIGLVISACGGGSGENSQITVAPESTTATEDTSAPTDPPQSDAAAGNVGSEPTEALAEAAPSFDGPPAPDFELALADGTTFTLSDEQKPVYVVFWAEW